MRVLIAGAHADRTDAVAADLIAWGYEVAMHRGGIPPRAAVLSGVPPDMVIVDGELPGMDGQQLCREIRRLCKEPIYIMLTAAERTSPTDALVAGADDWLPVPYRSDVFRARLWTAHRMIELQRALADTQQSLAREGERDSVTGHLKHRVMLEVLERELIRAQRAGVPVGVAIAEVDAFVAVTETFGRSIGHAVLHEAGRRLRDAVRRYDTVGRYRNHAFLAVLPGCDAVKIRLVAERLRTDIAASPMRIADLSLPVTLSIGVASSDRGAESPTASRLLEDAEAALDVAQVRGCTRIDIVPHTA